MTTKKSINFHLVAAINQGDAEQAWTYQKRIFWAITTATHTHTHTLS